MLYLGGYPYLLMLITPAIISLRSAWTIWKNKYIYGGRDQQFLIHVMCALIASFYFQSFFNQSLYHPTFTLSFFGVMMTILVIAMKSEVPHQRMLYEEWLDEAEWDDEEEDEEDWEDVAVPAPT